jgi:hypothetical protein
VRFANGLSDGGWNAIGQVLLERDRVSIQPRQHDLAP